MSFPNTGTTFCGVAAPYIWRLLTIDFILVSILTDTRGGLPIYLRKSKSEFFLLWNNLSFWNNFPVSNFFTFKFILHIHGFLKIFFGSTCIFLLTSSLSSKLFTSLAPLNMDICKVPGVVKFNAKSSNLRYPDRRNDFEYPLYFVSNNV